MRKDDDPISEIRRIRHSISEEFGHDPKRYITYLEKAGSDYPDQARMGYGEEQRVAGAAAGVARVELRVTRQECAENAGCRGPALQARAPQSTSSPQPESSQSR
uniref:Uncharacterized protein n=1 Tax=Candidatus Kentrum sp. DK TaxID=2126562 RepID=A0A450S3V2_9GAMM|nr:MAG: hypothetical protein BECKDK2373B_GA0170837_101335 [Candidatus Kentron sp. DK]